MVATVFTDCHLELFLPLSFSMKLESAPRTATMRRGEFFFNMKEQRHRMDKVQYDRSVVKLCCIDR